MSSSFRKTCAFSLLSIYYCSLIRKTNFLSDYMINEWIGYSINKITDSCSCFYWKKLHILFLNLFKKNGFAPTTQWNLSQMQFTGNSFYGSTCCGVARTFPVYRKWPTLLSWYLATVVTWDYNGPQHTLDPQISFCCHIFTLLLCFGTVWILVWGVQWGQSVFFFLLAGQKPVCIISGVHGMYLFMCFYSLFKAFFFLFL